MEEKKITENKKKEIEKKKKQLITLTVKLGCLLE
jgi:hypothetical protein